MTDTTQAGVLSREVTTSRPVTAATRPGYLFGPVFDFLTLGGLSIFVCGAIAILLPRGIPSAQQAVLVTILMTAINQPHFAHSYQMFYRNFREKAFGASYPAALRMRYIIAGLVVPAVLLAFLAGASLAGNARLLAYGANVMFFLVGWHYVKQGYGILIVDSVQKRIMFSDNAKTILRANGYACWMVAWLALNHAIAARNFYISLTYFSLPIPTWIYQSAIAVLAVTSLATAVFWRSAGVRRRGTAVEWRHRLSHHALSLGDFRAHQSAGAGGRPDLSLAAISGCGLALSVECRRARRQPTRIVSARPFLPTQVLRSFALFIAHWRFCSAFSVFSACRVRSTRSCPMTSTCSVPACSFSRSTSSSTFIIISWTM